MYTNKYNQKLKESSFELKGLDLEQLILIYNIQN